MSVRLHKTIATYNKIASSYADKVQPIVIPGREKYIQLIPKGGRILDVGCAAGRDTAYFHEQGYETIGIDLSKELLKIAKTKHPQISFQLMDLKHLKFVPDSFDGIWACAVLLHQSRHEITDILRGFHRILKPNGTLFIQVKKGTQEGTVKDVLSSDQERTFTYFLLDEMKGYLTEAHFSIIEAHEYEEKELGRNVTWLFFLAKKS